ncbi:hypothetical protein vseg_004017 [Gypsophila vaccaria]
MAQLLSSPSSSSLYEFWGEINGGNWYTIAAISFILIYHLIFRVILPNFRSSIARSNPNFAVSSVSLSSSSDGDGSLSSSRTSELVSESDLRTLIENLDEKVNETETWENVIEKGKSSVFYTAKCCKPKDGPVKYLSTTVFENCSPEILRDFYMDCEFRKQWDKTVIAYEQLQIDKETGVEIGRMIKKFPLLMPREYVLAWKIWEGTDKTFYCFTKECEHPLAPRQRKYLRAATFRSGWRIRQVPGRNACEIKMVHQEDSGLNVEMAKLAFAKGIWSYVCKMDEALRKYASSHHRLPSSAINAVSLIQKVPPELEAISRAGPSNDATVSSNSIHTLESGGATLQKVRKKPTKKMVVNGLLILGSLICLSHGNSSLGTKVAVSYVLKKFCKRGSSSGQNQQR